MINLLTAIFLFVIFFLFSVLGTGGDIGPSDRDGPVWGGRAQQLHMFEMCQR